MARTRPLLPILMLLLAGCIQDSPTDANHTSPTTDDATEDDAIIDDHSRVECAARFNGTAVEPRFVLTVPESDWRNNTTVLQDWLDSEIQERETPRPWVGWCHEYIDDVRWLASLYNGTPGAEVTPRGSSYRYYFFEVIVDEVPYGLYFDGNRLGWGEHPRQRQ